MIEICQSYINRLKNSSDFLFSIAFRNSKFNPIIQNYLPMEIPQLMKVVFQLPLFLANR